MFIIPGFIISLVTFPGVIIHELAHVAFCKLTNTPVQKVCYFRLGNPAGYVIHEMPSSVWRHILIGIGPLFVNTLLGLAIGLAVTATHHNSNGFWLWLSVSVATHSFPSKGDAESIWKAVWTKGAPISARILGTPLVMLIALGAAGSFFWLDVLYGFMIASALPQYILWT